MTKTVILVLIFSSAFGFVEASVVIYLRYLLGAGFTPPHIDSNEILFLVPGIAFLEPQTAVKIIQNTTLLNIERLREAATLVVLASVAALSGKKLALKTAFFLLAFGIWDIFYYLFLKLTIGWPQSFSDLDVFFFLPTPWVGPVLVPIIISFFLILGSLLYFKNHDSSNN